MTSTASTSSATMLRRLRQAQPPFETLATSTSSVTFWNTGDFDELSHLLKHWRLRRAQSPFETPATSTSSAIFWNTGDFDELSHLLKHRLLSLPK